MAGKLLFQVPPIPAIAELIEISLYVRLAKVVKGPLEEAFGERNGNVHAA